MPKTKIPKSRIKDEQVPKKKKYINRALVNDLDFEYNEGLVTSRNENAPKSSKISLSSLGNNTSNNDNQEVQKISISSPILTDVELPKKSTKKTKSNSIDSKKQDNEMLKEIHSPDIVDSQDIIPVSNNVVNSQEHQEVVLDSISGSELLNPVDEQKDELQTNKEVESTISALDEKEEVKKEQKIDTQESNESKDLKKLTKKQDKEDSESKISKTKDLDSEEKSILKDSDNIINSSPEPVKSILETEEKNLNEQKVELLPTNQNTHLQSSFSDLESCIEMTGIRKTFGTVVANDLINLNVKKGTVHALIGENGAGKSTLMSILFGIYKPDSGFIKINNNIVEISNPEQANNLGIGMVHQHFKQVDNMTVLQNIVLGNEIYNFWSGFISYKEDKEAIEKLMNRYNLRLKLGSLVSSLSVSEQQKLEIIKVLYKKSNIIIFDEPTAVLSPNEIKEFLQLVKDLKKSGKTVIIISHKIPELKEVADEATVIRLGKTIKTFDMAEATNSEISSWMVGREVKESRYPKNPDDYKGEVVLSVKDLVVHDSSKKVIKVNSVSFEVKAGEILGISGVEGSGQKEIADAISGLSKLSSGQITISSNNISIDISKASISKRYSHGMAFIPEDRHKHGLVLDETVNNNISLRNVDKFSFLGFVNYSKINKFGAKVCKDYDVRNAENGFAIARSLSGGNQQKVILGRELTSNSSFIIIFQPTRGLDVGSIEYVHSQIIEAKKQNKAILLISYELEEIIGICDRVLVMNAGEVTGELTGEHININNIGEKMIASGKEVI